MMYTDLDDGGVLVRHIVCVFNSSIPTAAAWVMNNLASYGAKEAAQTAEMTRKFLAEHFKT